MSPTMLLARAWAVQHRVRLLLVTAAIALACALVVFTISAYRAGLAQSARLAGDLMGPYDLVLMPRLALKPVIDPLLDQQLADDPAVARVVRTRVVYGDIEDAKDTTYYDSWRAAFIAAPDGRLPVPLASGRLPTAHAEVIEGVLSGGLARRWRIGVGDEMPMQGPGGQRRLRIVGVTAELLSHTQASGVFVTAAALTDLTAGTLASDRLYVDLVEGTATGAVERWRTRSPAMLDQVVAHDVHDFAAELGTDKAITNLRSMGAAAAIIAALAAWFIVATAIAAGADERRRQLALLRTVGMTRRQVVWSVVWEAALLASCGCVVGVPLGWLLLQGLAMAQRELFGGFIAPDPLGMIVAVCATGLGTIVASLRPALAAGRVKPIEAMMPAAMDAGAGHAVRRTALGFVALVGAVALLLTTRAGGFVISVAGTLTALGLLAGALWGLVPFCIRVCERVAGPVIARVAGLPRDLLRHQQGAHLERAGGMLLTIAVCLGFSVVMNVWGRSMVTPFLPSPALPDQVISLMPGGVPPAAAGEVAQMPGVDPARVLPLVVEQTAIAPELMAKTTGGLDEIYVQIIGVDPQALAPGERPLLPVDHEHGDPTAALAALSTPGTCLVPSSFARRFDLAIGDRFRLLACGGGNQPVELTVAGIASLPGWQWITKMGRMRTLDGKPTAVVLMHPDTAARLGVTAVRHWLADTTPEFDHQRLRAALQVLADRHADAFESAHFGPGIHSKPSVKLIGTGEVARRMQARSDEVIWLLGALPLAGLVVAVLGVANAVATGIRARVWEFGVLRAIGLEPRQARGLILGETLVVTTAAGVVCLGIGILAAWGAIDLSVRLMNTGTGTPAVVVPWVDLLIAWAITTAMCTLAAWLPARHLARRNPLALLHQGRSAA